MLVCRFPSLSMSPLFAKNLSLLHRLVAVMGVAIVLFLAVMSVRPDLHEELCQHAAKAASACGHIHSPDADKPAQDNGADACVISLFAHGHVLTALILVFLFALRVVRADAFTLVDFVALPAPAYRLPHGCGPPLV